MRRCRGASTLLVSFSVCMQSALLRAQTARDFCPVMAKSLALADDERPDLPPLVPCSRAHGSPGGRALFRTCPSAARSSGAPRTTSRDTKPSSAMARCEKRNISTESRGDSGRKIEEEAAQGGCAWRNCEKWEEDGRKCVKLDDPQHSDVDIRRCVPA